MDNEDADHHYANSQDFPAIHDKCGLLGHQMIYFENMNPDQTAPLQAIVKQSDQVSYCCFHAKGSLVYIKIYAASIKYKIIHKTSMGRIMVDRCTLPFINRTSDGHQST